jgi:uncharacterized ion transporter superfamily protein YfcC
VRAPNVFVLVLAILVAVCAATWVVPGGQYDRVEKKLATGTKKIVVADSFKDVEAERQGPWQMLQAPLEGFVQAADIIGFILLVGGAFGVLSKTGAILAFLAWLTIKVGSRTRVLVIPILMLTFSLGGALFGMSEEIIVFIPLTVPLAVALGYDVITGIAIPFVGTQLGFAAAFVNPFTLGIAKGIAEQPLDEGRGYRIVCWAVLTVVGIALVMSHARRVQRDPANSPSPELDAQWRTRFQDPSAATKLTRRHVAVLVSFLGSMVVLALGALRWDWYIGELSGLFLGMALVCGVVSGLGANTIADSFVEGTKELAACALLVALSRSILVVAEKGKIIDSMLHSLAGMLDGLDPTITAELMYLAHTAINFFVPSGSGQAALTMPIMTPLSDLTSVPRETAILAFQLGDGLTNLIIPTSAVLIGVMSMARLELGTWLRWMWKRQLALCILGGILIALAPW